ncbi:MAG: hypothetical protein KDB80_04410 [Planctomycetes bacterium]|nr:hypothetical protein [Planctomycetota bacterium]
MPDAAIASLFDRFDPPFGDSFDPARLGPEFAEELRTVSRLWFRCGYRPGIGAYLNFFLLVDFIRMHDARFPARFASLRSMAQSFYETDLFIRAVTDSGREATGGISSPAVRELLRSIMARHAKLRIPPWMMSYFGSSLFENVERQCDDISDDERRWHLNYMAKTYRIFGIPFTDDRELLEAFSRAVENRYAGTSDQVEKHARHILRIGEMIGVSSKPESILPMLPEPTRAHYAPIESRVRPGWLRRKALRVVGRFAIGQAVGEPRVARPWTSSGVDKANG